MYVYMTSCVAKALCSQVTTTFAEEPYTGALAIPAIIYNNSIFTRP
jgi:hypothetical protein